MDSINFKNNTQNQTFFTGKVDKLILSLINQNKTPRAYKTADVLLLLKELGYTPKKITGSHFHFENQSGKVFTFVGKNSTVDPKTIKEIIELLKREGKFIAEA